MGGRRPAFSPDGRRLATVSHGTWQDERGAIQLWGDVPTARQVWAVEGAPGAGSGAAFSPDGRTLAASGEQNSLILFETATGTQRDRITGHASAIQSVTFAGDGRTLAASSRESPVYVWDWLGLSEFAGRPPTAAERDQLWSDLARGDAKSAFQAIRRLAAVPGRRRGTFRPAPEARGGGRGRARPRIGGPARQPPVRRPAAGHDRTGESRRPGGRGTASRAQREGIGRGAGATVQRLLDRIDAGTPDMLRAIRAVETLERIGTPAAKAHLRHSPAALPGRS